MEGNETKIKHPLWGKADLCSSPPNTHTHPRPIPLPVFEICLATCQGIFPPKLPSLARIQSIALIKGQKWQRHFQMLAQFEVWRKLDFLEILNQLFEILFYLPLSSLLRLTWCSPPSRIRFQTVSPLSPTAHLLPVGVCSVMSQSCLILAVSQVSNFLEFLLVD